VTAGIDDAVDPIRKTHHAVIDCITLENAPFGIETDTDIRAVVPMIVHEITARNRDYDAFVIACYSDPGLDESRAVTRKPVFGLQESAVGLSVARDRRFGVLALGRDSIRRHVAYVRGLGLDALHAAERPLDISVDDAVRDPATLGRIIEVGRELVDEDGAETVILGCAGMAAHRQVAEERLGVPVVDPVQAAVTMAVETLRTQEAPGDEAGAE
jgi:Asp/Glu/hydantoin racemase